MPGGYSRYGINGRVLDTPVSDFGGSGNRSPFGECSTWASCSRQKIRCPGLPVASISALGGLAEGLVSPRTGGLRNSLSDAPSRKPRGDVLRACPTHAQVAGPDESADSSRHQ